MLTNFRPLHPPRGGPLKGEGRGEEDEEEEPDLRGMSLALDNLSVPKRRRRQGARESRVGGTIRAGWPCEEATGMACQIAGGPIARHMRAPHEDMGSPV